MLKYMDEMKQKGVYFNLLIQWISPPSGVEVKIQCISRQIFFFTFCLLQYPNCFLPLVLPPKLFSLIQIQTCQKATVTEYF